MIKSLHDQSGPLHINLPSTTSNNNQGDKATRQHCCCRYLQFSATDGTGLQPTAIVGQCKHLLLNTPGRQFQIQLPYISGQTKHNDCRAGIAQSHLDLFAQFMEAALIFDHAEVMADC